MVKNMNWLKCPKCEQKSCEINITIDSCSAYCHRCGWDWESNDHWVEILTPSEYFEIFGCESGKIHNKIEKIIINLIRSSLNGRFLSDFGLLSKGLVDKGLNVWCLKSLENESVTSKLSKNWYKKIIEGSIKLNKYEYIGNCDNLFDSDGDCNIPIFKDLDDLQEIKDKSENISSVEFFNLIGKDDFVNELLGHFNDYIFLYNNERDVIIALNKISNTHYIFCQEGKCIAKKNKNIKLGFDLISIKFKKIKDTK